MGTPPAQVPPESSSAVGGVRAMATLSESQAFLDQFDKCLPLCERGDVVTVVNALHSLNEITQAGLSQAVELDPATGGRDFVCSFVLELELALELFLAQKLGTIDGGLPRLYPFFKTVMCKNFRDKGFCKFGAKCNFAHGESELRKLDEAMGLSLPARPQSPDSETSSQTSSDRRSECSVCIGGASNFKTSMCKNYREKGFCKFGDKCNFAHGKDELRRKDGAGDKKK